MSTLNPPIQNCNGGSRQFNTVRRKNKRHIDQKGRNKTIVCPDDIIAYIEYPKVSKKKLKDLITQFSKVQAIKSTLKSQLQDWGGKKMAV